MPKSYSIADAKSHLSRLVNQAQEGPPVQLTRRGHAVAVLLSIREYEHLSRPRMDSWDVVEKLRRTHDLAALDIDPDEVYAVNGECCRFRDIAKPRNRELDASLK